MLIDSSNFIFMKLETYESILTSQNCKLNCIKGFNKNVKIENKKSSSSNNKANNTMIVYSKSNLIRKTSGSKIIEQVQTYQGKDLSKKNRKNTQFIQQTTKNRKNSINNDLIIKAFDTSNCVVEEDWHEWFKSTTKVLFDQSPS